MFTTVVVGNSQTVVANGRMITPRIYAAKSAASRSEPCRAVPITAQLRPDEIMSESFAIIDRELGPEPSDTNERSIIRRVIHASADFDFAWSFRFSAGAVDASIAALRRGASVITDVEMLRTGLRMDCADRLGVRIHCSLNDPGIRDLSTSSGSTRSALGIRRAAEELGDGALVAIGNAPTALDEAIDLVERGAWKPSCIIGIPVGFVGVEEAKRRLAEQSRVPYITSMGRKGGTAVTAAAVNALLALACGLDA
jgi:precorrin-8X/cobalt-precorrin-8 methylmutase